MNFDKEEQIRFVYDTNNNIYEIDKKLGEGGQGAVYSVSNHSYAVKIVFEKDSQTETLVNNAINSLLIKKDIPGINICKPIAKLAHPYCGYVMHLVENLKPVSNLIIRKSSVASSDVADFFKKTGYLKKRVEVLVELARTLSIIHFYGLKYCDISPNNIFYSDSNNFSKIWLIDCDNLSENYKSIRVYTPGYAAPEVEFHSFCNSIQSDIFSFAVLAFEILTGGIHPFKYFVQKKENSNQDSVGGWSQTSTDNFHEEFNENNIDFETLESTLSDSSLEISDSFTKELKALFLQTFSKNYGYKNPFDRPNMIEWYKALVNLYNKIVVCPKCEDSYFYSSRTTKCSKDGSKATVLGNYYYAIKTQIFKDAYKNMIENSIFLSDFLEKNKSKNFLTYPVFDYSIPLYENQVIYNFTLCSFSQAPTKVFEVLKIEKVDSNYITVKNICNDDSIKIIAQNKTLEFDDTTTINKGQCIKFVIDKDQLFQLNLSFIQE